MADRIVKEYKNSFSLNGDELSVISQKVRWSGKGTDLPGYWLMVRVSSNGGEIYRDQREITREFRAYAELKHKQIVGRVRKCGSLEKVSLAIEEIF